MEHQLAEILERMEQESKKQVFYAKIQCIFSVIAAVCCMVLLILGFKFMPQIQTLADRADVVLTNLETVTEELATVDLSGLEDVIAELAEVDLSGLEEVVGEMAAMDLDSIVDHIDGLVAASHKGIDDTMGKLNSINFETLNKTIEDLSAVVERLAKITKFLG